MRIQLFAGIALCAMLLAGAKPTCANVAAPKSVYQLEYGESKERVLTIGDVYEFNDKLLVCLNKQDSDELIALETSGYDSTYIYLKKTDCNVLKLPALLLFQNFGAFQMHDGRKFWYLQMQSLDRKINLYIEVPYEWFESPNN